MSIPWTVERRPDTGQYNGRLGMWLFIAADAMFMGALFSSLAFLRAAADEGAVVADSLPLWGAVASLILIEAAAIAVAIAWKRSSTSWLIGNLVVALAAVLVLSWDAASVAPPAENTFVAMYHVLNGIVRLHIFGAIVAVLWMLVLNGGMRRDDSQRFKNRVECLGLFWHFTGIAWVISFAMLYLL